MRKAISLFLFILSVLALVSAISCSVYGIIDIHRTLSELAADPTASGVEYFGIGWEYGIGTFLPSAIGLILSVINRKIAKQKWIRYGSIIAVIAFSLLVLLAVFMFYR